MPRLPDEMFDPEDEFDANEFAADDLEADPRPGSCAICESAPGECDHLVASIDRTFSEIVAGAIFVHQREIREIMEALVALGPDLLNNAGSAPALEQVAESVAADIGEGVEPGEALAENFPRLLAALSHMLQEDSDVSVSEVDGEEQPGQSSSFENLWADDPEGVVERLIERLNALAEDAE